MTNTSEKKICKECGKPVDLKAGDDIHPMGVSLKLAPDYGGVELCRACFSVGWIDNPSEVRDGIINDPELRNAVQYPSPIQREDLLN